MSKGNTDRRPAWGLSEEFDRSRKRENIIWVAAMATLLLAAGVVPRLLSQGPAPVLREDEPALVVAMTPPHNEARYDIAPGFSEDVAGEIRVTQCSPETSPATAEELRDCHEFPLYIQGRDEYASLDLSTDVGDIILVAEKPSI